MIRLIANGLFSRSERSLVGEERMPRAAIGAVLASLITSSGLAADLKILLPSNPDPVTDQIVKFLSDSQALAEADVRVAPLTDLIAEEREIEAVEQGKFDLAIIDFEKFRIDAGDSESVFLDLVGQPFFENGSGTDIERIVNSNYRLLVEAEIGRSQVVALSILTAGDAEIVSALNIEALSDFEGKKLAADAIVYETLQDIGAVPIKIASAEVQARFDRGSIDGFENASAVDRYEAASSTIVQEFRPLYKAIVANESSWISLSESQRVAIEGVLADAEDLSLEISRSLEESRVASAVERGIDTVSFRELLTPADRDDLAAAWVSRNAATRSEPFNLAMRMRPPSGESVPLGNRRFDGAFYFVTDREEESQFTDLSTRFGPRKGQSMKCGQVAWTRNPERDMGTSYGGPIRAVGEATLREGDACVELVTQTLSDESGQITVFVHGYANDFRGSIGRAIAAAEDLQLKGLVILWSWPSMGKYSGYAYDGEGMSHTRIRFMRFVKALVERSEVKNLDIITHSTGGRAGLFALEALNKAADKVRNVIFIAPDVAVATFRDRLSLFQDVADIVTLYASEYDMALIASAEIVNKESRAGIGGSKIMVSKYWESIDASEVDNEGWLGQFGDADANHRHALKVPEAVDDVRMLIKDGLVAEKRGLMRREKDELPYWVIERR